MHLRVVTCGDQVLPKVHSSEPIVNRRMVAPVQSSSRDTSGRAGNQEKQCVRKQFTTPKQPETLSAMEQMLAQGAENPNITPTARLAMVHQAISLLVKELPAHGKLLRRVQHEFDMLAEPGGMLIPSSSNPKPDYKVLLPSAYYQAELRRAEANLKISLSHGPRLRRVVRQLRLGCAEAIDRIEAIDSFASSATGPPQTSLEARLAAARVGLSGSADPSSLLVSPEVEEAILNELDELLKIRMLLKTRMDQVSSAAHRHPTRASPYMRFQ